ncbi:MAG: serine/threonine protein phosphatase [Syntrophorhabdaceae bacterium]|nr:serine/threonine protein phosphatase [Syntrophorhabdaceae bacterium]
MKTLIIGDIHGNFEALMKALENADYKDGDRLIVLGDYIDRGPQPREVLEFLLSLKNGSNIYLRGNHEELLIRALHGDTHAYDVLINNGFADTLVDYGVDMNSLVYKQNRHYIKRDGSLIPLISTELALFLKKVFPKEHLEFIDGTKYMFETDAFFYSHAGALPYKQLIEQSGTDYLWGMDDEFLKSRYNYGKTLVFGHYHMVKPLISRRKICIGMDSGVRILITDYSPMVLVDSEGGYEEVKEEWLAMK